MWKRAMLKEKAKAVLRVSYWKAFLVSLILIFAFVLVIGGMIGNFLTGIWNSRDKGFNNPGNFNSFNQQMFLDILPHIMFAVGIIVLVLILVLAIRIFLGYHLEIGGKKFFINATLGNVDLNYLTYGLDRARYYGIIRAMIRRDVQLFFWSLLLIIPAIVKSYSYMMVPYILTDNPNIGSKRAIEISNETTYGEKWKLFVLDLSFIGWRILGVLALFVGTFFVEPYVLATKAELYLALRQKAVHMGLSNYGELLLEMPDKDNGDGQD